jgi:serine/threonine protein kinase
MLQQLLSALVYLHDDCDPQIVHRDISPKNILVSRRYNGRIIVKLADFGVAEDNKDKLKPCGTPGYMAPELFIKEHPRCSPKSDIWSLGMSLYRCTFDEFLDIRGMGIDWCKDVIMRFRDNKPGPLAGFILENMLVFDLESRHPARECSSKLQEASDRLCSENEDCSIGADRDGVSSVRKPPSSNLAPSSKRMRKNSGGLPRGHKQKFLKREAEDCEQFLKEVAGECCVGETLAYELDLEIGGTHLNTEDFFNSSEVSEDDNRSQNELVEIENLSEEKQLLHLVTASVY